MRRRCSATSNERPLVRPGAYHHGFQLWLSGLAGEKVRLVLVGSDGITCLREDLMAEGENPTEALEFRAPAVNRWFRGALAHRSEAAGEGRHFGWVCSVSIELAVIS